MYQGVDDADDRRWPMLREEKRAKLRRELSKQDPWRLQTNAFETRRYALMRNSLDGLGRIERAMEVGCGSGVFSEMLAARCHRLDIVDVAEEALCHARARLCSWTNVSYRLVDVSNIGDAPGVYDVIVAAEVLYYRGPSSEVGTTVGALIELLKPGGHFLFCSGRDHCVRRWGYECGAESTLALLTATLSLENRACRGVQPNEDAEIALLRRPRDARP